MHFSLSHFLRPTITHLGFPKQAVLQSKHSSVENKTGTSQVGAISKAQKTQNIFFGKKLEIFEKFLLSENVAQCRKM